MTDEWHRGETASTLMLYCVTWPGGDLFDESSVLRGDLKAAFVHQNIYKQYVPK